MSIHIIPILAPLISLQFFLLPIHPMLCGAAWLTSSIIILLLPKDFDRDINPSRHRRIALLLVFIEFMGAPTALFTSWWRYIYKW